MGEILACLFTPALIARVASGPLMGTSVGIVGVCLLMYPLMELLPGGGVYEVISIAVRFVGGFFAGITEVVVFAAQVAVFPDRLGTVSAIAESVLNGAIAFSPFLGSVLYASGGFKIAFLVPGALILASAVPTLFSPQVTKEVEERGVRWRTVLDPWVLFPLWHLACCQILLFYFVPLLSIYAEEEFGKDVVWVGTALLLNTAFICVCSPVWGILMDKYSPYHVVIVSCVFLPVVYIFLGPLPLLSWPAPSPTQMLVALSLIGCFVPAGCTPALLLILDVYKIRYGEIPVSVTNALVSLYCASYYVGIFIGTTGSGFLAEVLGFRWSVSAVGLAFVGQAVLCGLFCWRVGVMRQAKRAADTVVYENKQAEGVEGELEGVEGEVCVEIRDGKGKLVLTKREEVPTGHDPDKECKENLEIGNLTMEEVDAEENDNEKIETEIESETRSKVAKSDGFIDDATSEVAKSDGFLDDETAENVNNDPAAK